MSRPGFVPQNHPNQLRSRELALVDGDAPPSDTAESPARSTFPPRKQGVDDTVDDRETPPCVFVPLDAECRFTLDAAAAAHNAKCQRYCTPEGFFLGAQKLRDEDGLRFDWGGERVWLNPPFSGLRPWVEKAWDDYAELVCMLLPNNRSEQPFWQKWVEPYRDRPGSILTTRHLPKRRPFLHRGEGIGNRTSKNPPFGLVVVTWDRRVLGREK